MGKSNTESKRSLRPSRKPVGHSVVRPIPEVETPAEQVGRGQTQVDPHHMERVGIRATLAAPRVEHAQVRLGEEEPATGERDEVLAGKGPAGTVLGDGTVQQGGADVERRDLEGAQLTVELRAHVDGLHRAIVQPDTPAEEGVPVAREVVRVDSLEEELAFLGEAEGEPGQVHLPVVDLRLRKVGVDGEVRAQIRGDVVEDVRAEIAGVGRGGALGGDGGRAPDEVRLHVQPEPLPDFVEPCDETRPPSSPRRSDCARSRSSGLPRSYGRSSARS